MPHHERDGAEVNADLVADLRNLAEQSLADPEHTTPWKAADEIEALRAEVSELADEIDRLTAEQDDTVKALGEAADIIVDLRAELDAANEDAARGWDHAMAHPGNYARWDQREREWQTHRARIEETS